MRLRIAVKFGLIVAVMLGLTLSQASAQDRRIYGRESLTEAGMTLSVWGSGSAVESSDPGIIGTHSIQITSSSLYNGAFINFNTPVQIADPSVITRHHYLLLQMNFRSLTPLGISDPSRTPTARRDFRPVPPYYDAGNYWGEELPQVPRVRNIRVILHASDGRVTSHTGRVVMKETDEDGWVAVALPLASFGITQETNGFPLSKMAIGLDYSDTVRIGEIAIISDDTPIYVDPLDDQVVGTQDIIIMRGRADAGRTAVEYSWDFNAADGIQEDAHGELVQVVYRRAGTYRITLTVRDPDGIKSPVTTSAEIVVN